MNILPLRVALAQVNVTVGDLEGNTRKILASMQQAYAAGAHIVCLPELALTGYPPEDLLLTTCVNCITWSQKVIICQN